MSAGQLRHRVDVLRVTATPDGAGGTSEAETVIAVGRPMAIDEAPPAFRVGQIIGGAVADRLWIIGLCRHLAGLDVGAVVVWRGRRYTVRGVRDPYARGVWLEFAADRVH